MYRVSAVGKKQQFAFSGGRQTEDRHGILLAPSWSRGTGCSHPAPPPLHSSTQTLISLQPIASSPPNFPSQIPCFLSASGIPDAGAGACSLPIAPPTPNLPFPRASGRAKPMWSCERGRELQHKRALCALFVKRREPRFWEQDLSRDLKQCLCDGFVNSTENMHRADDRSLYWAKFAS